MADTLPSRISEAALMESEACSNRAAFRLWRRARGGANFPCGAERDDSAALIYDFVGRRDIPARLLAGLVLDADLRPDDRLWVQGARPGWLIHALSLTAGLADKPEAGSVLVTECWPHPVARWVRRIIVTGGDEAARGDVPPGVTLSLSREWD